MSIPTNIEDYFNKSFEFTGNDHWALPASAYKTPPWRRDALQQMKMELNCIKGQLSNFDLDKWSKHTVFRDLSSYIPTTMRNKYHVELLTRAWCKFYECLNRYRVVPEVAVAQSYMGSLHLCEAPGGFISALNRFLYSQHRHTDWTWRASTLNPYYEGNPPLDMIDDDRLIRFTLDYWNFGLDQTGDLTRYYNHEELVKDELVELVTADGSVDCINDPGEQESNVHFLHYCEVITALKVLVRGGSFVVKMFTMFEHGTVCLLYLLNCCFLKVHVFKPCTSKSGNSEVYVICLEFKGCAMLEPLWNSLVEPFKAGEAPQNRAMFPEELINTEFLQQVEECADYFMHLQINIINNNIRHFIHDLGDSEQIKQLKTIIAEYYSSKYYLSRNFPKSYRLVTGKIDYRFKKRVHDGWDLVEINGCDLGLCEPNLTNVTTGRALVKVRHSQFTHKSLESPRVKLESTDLSFMSLSEVKIIQDSDFSGQFTQGKLHKEFFGAVTDRLDEYENLVIVGVPLLTRFLVGVVYVLAVGFESTMVFKSGVLVFRKRREATWGAVKGCFQIIEDVYRRVGEEQKFDADILEVVPKELFRNEKFADVICQYNNRLYE